MPEISGMIQQFLEGNIKTLSGSEPVIESKNITENGTYTAPEGVDGYSPITVNVPTYTPVIESKSITANGTYTAPEGVDGYSPITVNVPLPSNAYLLKSVSNLPQPIASFSDGAVAPMMGLKVGIEPQQEGSGDPSPTNIRPISGWSEANVSVCGKNWFDKNELIPNKAYSNNFVYSKATGISTGFVPVKEGTTITVSGMKNWGIAYINCFVDGYEGNYISSVGSRTGSGEIADPATVIVPSGAKYLAIACYTGPSDYERFHDKDTIQVEIGSSATTYESYNPNSTTYTIPFTDSQGNPIEVFGGECDVVNGGGSAYKEYDSYNGETLIGPWISDRDVYAPNTSPTIGAQVVDKGDISTFNTIPTAVKSLRGVNNVYANTGDIKDVEYFSKEG